MSGQSQVLRFANVIVLCLVTLPAGAQQKEQEWTWKDGTGKARTRVDLREILRKHKLWLESKGQSGERANLSREELTRGDRATAELLGPELEHTNLSQGLLSGVNLGFADLKGADFHDADLKGANLTSTDLSGADLSGADLAGANLDSADLRAAKLTGITLTATRLSEAKLVGADLSGVDLSHSNLTRADLYRANLASADVSGANLGEAVLREADLRDVSASNTDFSRAILNWADLRRADLRDATLAGVSLFGADVYSTVFEPTANPETRSTAAAQNLEFMTYGRNPDALVQLRKQFGDGGFLTQERKITYALRRREADIILHNHCELEANLLACGEYLFKRVFFDWTCRYGMTAGRPLRLGLVLLLLCAVIYAVAIHLPGQSGLYRIETETVLQTQDAKPVPTRVCAQPLAPAGLARYGLAFLLRELNVLWIALFFSLMCAFNIGFRDINFGRWLRLLTLREYDIKAVGWVRPIAGVQSLGSLYLIALWLLTYFGRPFE